MTEERKQSLHPISSVLCQVYRTLYVKGEVSFPITDDNIEKIDTIVKTVYSSYFGITRFSTEKEQASVFFCLIIKDHPMIDGNKRLAVLWLQVFCDAFNLKIESKIPLDELAVSVESEKKIDIDELYFLIRRILFTKV